MMNSPTLFIEAVPDASLIVLSVAVVGVIGTGITAYFAYKGNKELSEAKAEVNSLKVLQAATEISLKAAKQEVDLDSYALSISSFMEGWNDVAVKLHKLFAETTTTRFLILRAWNGHDKPRYTTAIVQYRQGQVECSEYIHLDLDDDYIEKLINLRRRKILRIDTADEAETVIGGIYRNENPAVSRANWFFIKDERVDEKRVILTYCSFGKVDAAPFTELEEIKQRLIAALVAEKFDIEKFVTR